MRGDKKMTVAQMIKQIQEGRDGSNKGPRVIFLFERGAYFDGDLRYRIEEKDDEYWFYGSGSGRFDMKEYRFRLSEEDVDMLKDYVLQAKDWPEENNAVGVLDGYYWVIYYDYKGLTINTSGYMKFPEGFKIIIGNIQLYMEHLCLTYAEDYDCCWEKRVTF